MTFSKEWDDLYKDQKHLSVWPWSDVVSYVMRYARPNKKSEKVLEVGFGAGANIPFFERLQTDFHGIDGSSTIVELLKKQYPQYATNLVCGDFTKEIPFDVEFDLIIDRGSITQNDTNSIEKALDLVYCKLKKGRKFIGIDWFSQKYSAFLQTDCVVVDDYTRTDFRSGYFQGLGKTHFSDRRHLTDLLKNARFKIEKLEHKIHEDYSPNSKEVIHTFASWNFVAVKE